MPQFVRGEKREIEPAHRLRGYEAQLLWESLMHHRRLRREDDPPPDPFTVLAGLFVPGDDERLGTSPRMRRRG